MIVKIFNEPYLKRLDNIKQWQEIDVFKEESVSQHSYKVLIFGRVLLEDIFGKNNCPKVLDFKLACLDALMFHDWDEALILRDMSHETKYNAYNGEKIREVLNDFAHHRALEEFCEKNPTDGLFTPASCMMVDNICSATSDAKLFCKLCDWLALIFYMKRERELGNNNLYAKWEYCRQKATETAEKVIDVLKFRFDIPGVVLNFDELNNLIKTLWTQEDKVEK